MYSLVKMVLVNPAVCKLMMFSNVNVNFNMSLCSVSLKPDSQNIFDIPGLNKT